VRPKRVIADTTYGTGENVRELEESGIRADVPLPDWDGRSPYCGPSLFVYDRQRDVYVCPQGEPLRRAKVKWSERRVYYQADAAVCNACPVKAACTASDWGRGIVRLFDADYLDRVRGYHATEAYKRAMCKRKVWIEPLFGEAKQWHGLRQFRLRELMKVNMEGLLITAGQNLKRFGTEPEAVAECAGLGAAPMAGWGGRMWRIAAVHACRDAVMHPLQSVFQAMRAPTSLVTDDGRCSGKRP
jgi:hypothetical protein